MRRVVGLAALFAVALAGPSRAQFRFAVDSRASLAWWQIQPHMGHLWATTCPADPSWYAGATHSQQYRYSIEKDPTRGRGGIVPNAEEDARTPIPLFPRDTVRQLCPESVRGEVVASDTARWRGVRGLIVVSAAALVSGDDNRDNFTRKRVLQTESYPDIRFTIDSLIDVQKGDTTEAMAVGSLQIHGVTKEWRIPVRIWRERLGLRVTGQSAFAAPDLVDMFHISKFPLGLGVGTQVWKFIHLGIDAVLRPVS